MPEPLARYRLTQYSASAEQSSNQRKMSTKIREMAIKRRGVRLSFADRAKYTAHRFLSILFAMSPQMHWGMHQMLLGDLAKGRGLLAKAAKHGLKEKLVASVALAAPDGVLKVLRKIAWKGSS